MHARWPELGMLDPEAVRLEWQLNPDANVGALCAGGAFGGSGLTIVDVDLPDGYDTLRRLEKDYQDVFPFTAAVATPSGGAHYYLTGVTASWNPGPGLEIRSAGRQCVAPPSVHPNGGRYRWFQDPESVTPLPGWLTAAGCDPVTVKPRERRTFSPSGLRDPVLEVPPPVYFGKLCGLTPDRQGFVPCPAHPFKDSMPSCKVYATADRGWFCYGEECRKGGDVVTLAAELAGIPTPVRGYEFIACLDYLRGLFSS